MTRRISLAIVSALIAALVLVGVGTITLANARARATTERDLRAQVADVADRLQQALAAPAAADESSLGRDELFQRRLRTARLVTRFLSLDDFSVVTVGPRGVQGEVPAAFTASRLDIRTMKAGATQASSRAQQVVVARAVGLNQRLTAVVIATRRPNAGLGASVRWFAIASLVTVALGTIVAAALGRRLARPVREASAAARRLAGGELSTRLAPPPPGATDELAELTNSINTMAANLERSRAVEQQFLLSVSHDLRTPLTSIRGYAEAISEGRGDPAKAGSVILAESRRLERLVRDLLDLGKLQARSFTMHPQRIDVAALATAIVEGAQPDAAARGVNLAVESTGPVIVTADHDRLSQVVSNLVENALKYANGSVVVTIDDTGAGAMLAVDDDGPGIPPADQAHVFDRLYVGRHQLERKETGSGLGLAIARELVEAMGATIAAHTSSFGGARLVIRFGRPSWSAPAPSGSRGTAVAE